MARILPQLGISLQVVFFILFFGTLLPKINNMVATFVCLFIGLSSLIAGIYSVKSQQNLILSIAVIIIALLILGFTIFAYFLGEAGYPPLIMQ
ncbi:alpha/beta hydrolase [Peribacillus simplex]|uniref:alpha/beta hydrolase n=1 Tax=Peribacillus simplex TaxID=1478 RepID=UPI0028536FA9|nr:alpha/beta hydrolase [Peribacillus simplex]MDR4927779.1 alpha/beta hydrolase [Peribacillus simplex]